MTITSAERDRLIKLLGMLSSDFENERATAAAMITRMAREKKLTIPELTIGSARPTAKPKWPDGILAGLAFALRYDLNHWEAKFASDVSSRYAHDESLSVRQRSSALKIISKARSAAIRNGDVDR